MPNVLGVSSPSGMAVTVALPVERAKRKAIQVNTRSPTSTPNAVPGTMCAMANSMGNWNVPCSRPTISTRSARLSRTRPKKALTSPAAAQR